MWKVAARRRLKLGLVAPLAALLLAVAGPLAVHAGPFRVPPLGHASLLTGSAAPTLALQVGAVSYQENDPPTIIFGDATVSDTGSGFDTGRLTVDFSANGSADDRLAIRNQGTGDGEIGVDGNNVTYTERSVDGSFTQTIGTFSGGTSGSSPLVVTFNSDANQAAVQALVRNVTYENVSDAPSTAARTVRFVVTDADSNTTAEATRTIEVTAVNDAPSFTKGPDQTLNEDAGLQTVSGWATAISPGPPAEAGQTLTFLVSNNNTAQFSAQPAISSSGTLTFTPTVNASGNTTVTVRLQDNGGTANGGVDASAEQTFTITVAPVNDPPTFDPIADQSVVEDSGARNVRITGVSSGPPDEAGQTVTLTATSSNTAIVPHPSIIGAGATRTLIYTPAANANGTVTITLTADDRQAANNTFSRTFTISVGDANDPPTISDIASRTINEGSSTGPIAFTVGDPDGQVSTLSLTGTSSNSALVSNANITFGGAGADRAVTVSPAANQSGTATITVTVSDGVASASDSFELTVNDVPEAPTPRPTCRGKTATIVATTSAYPITGTNGDDVIVGSAGPDLIHGGGGNDTICGLGGNDRILGGAGDDTIDGGDGNDFVDGGAGNDFIDGGTGNDLLSGGLGHDLLDGDSGNDRIDGGSGNDRILGGSGNDRIAGGTGRDRLSGGLGRDFCIGGPDLDRASRDCERIRTVP